MPWLFLGMNGLVHSAHEAREGVYRAELDKSCLLRQIIPAIAAAAIPRPWLKRSSVRPSTHADLAAMMGYKWRSSYTRNAGKAPKFVAASTAAETHARGRRSRAHVKSAIKGCVYHYVFDEGEHDRLEKRPDLATDEADKTFTMPDANEMRDDPKWAAYWSRNSKRWGMYFSSPGWTMHPDTPGTPYNKLVLQALASFGLFDLDLNGHCKGEIQEEYATIGTRVGLSRDAVRSALEFYGSDEGGAIFQVVEHPGHYELNGKAVPGGWEKDGQPVKKGTEGAEYIQPPEGSVWRQPPNTIYYVAGREFDDDRVLAERQRFLEAAKPFRDSPWFPVADELHAAILREWRSTRQLERTFWAECRRRMHQAVKSTLIEGCIPKPPP